MKVGPERAKSIARLDAYSELKKAGYTPLPVIDGEVRAGRAESQTCIFLQGGGCTIHREDGGFAKPTVCQLYPFHLVKTPGGWYLSLSFSCPSVVKGGGQPVEEQLPSVRKTLEESEYFSPDRMPVDTPVNLVGALGVSWTEYLESESAILQTLDEKGAVAGSLRLAASLKDFAHSRPESWTPVSFAPVSLRQIAELLPSHVAYAVAALEGGEDKKHREKLCDQLLSGQEAESALLGRPLILDLHDCKDEHTRTTLQRFLRNVVLGKRLLEGGSLMSRLLCLAVSTAILHLYHHHGATLEWCFDLLETHLLNHSDRHKQIFNNYEALVIHPGHRVGDSTQD